MIGDRSAIHYVKPCEGELSDSDAFALRELFHSIHQCDILVEVPLGKFRLNK